jgi:hypothetical protein
MDKAAKAKIKRLVLDLRRLLEADVTVGLKRLGILADRNWLPETQVPRPDEEVFSRRARIAVVVQASMDQGSTRQEATQEYIRRTALTYLIRLVGLKCLEVRNLIDEVITTRVEYGGRSLFHRDFRHAYPELATQSDDALPAALEAACLVAQELHTLFDPDDDWSIIQPRYNTLKEAIARINGLPTEIWLEDEIVGWVYQFYRIEDRNRVRKRGLPQKADDVAAINQFYTPRWIVQFLVDNTLGRLWLEMHPDSRVRQKCTYLVPTADLPQPSDEPVREAKPPWEIRLLDPACGTMHFGFYASEVFLEMYREARERHWADRLSDGRSIFDLTEAEVVSCIFFYNLFGITIDTWAARLATLSLYMKLKALHSEARVIRLNIICADATLSKDGEVRQQFLKEFVDDGEMQKALGEIFATMSDIAQVGSLFHPREQLQRILKEMMHPTAQWEDQQRSAAEKGQTPVRQRELGEITGPGVGWRVFRPLDEVLEKVRDFANQCRAENNHTGRFLALETQDNLHLLDVLLQPYDVVVMNPPYGKTTAKAKQYLCQIYPQTHHDLYAAFFERALGFLQDDGYIGALTSRTFLYLKSFRQLREQLLLKKLPPIVALDLGFGVLDGAVVETVATVLRADSQRDYSKGATFFRLNVFADERRSKLEDLLSNFQHNGSQELIFIVPLHEFSSVPNSPFAYWTSRSLRDLFSRLPSFGMSFAEVKQGLATSNDARFLRQWWEVQPVNPDERTGWIPFAKGGDYCKYYHNLDLVINWLSDGKELKEYIRAKDGSVTKRIYSQAYYFLEGLTYPRVTVKGFNVRKLPAGSIFADKGPSIFPKSKEIDSLWFGLGLLNSTLTQAFLLIMTPSRSFEVGHVSQLPFAQPTEKQKQHIAQLAQTAHDLKAAWDTGNEICNRFSQPWLLQLYHLRLAIDDLRLAQGPNGGQQSDNQSSDEPGLAKVIKLLEQPDLLDRKSEIVNLKSLLDEVRDIETAADSRLQELQAQIDEAVYDLYSISLADRVLIERELGNRPPELIWPQMEGKADKEKRREHVRRLLSYFILGALKADQDGILPLVERTGDATVLDQLREGLEAAFGAEAAFRLEDNAGRVLGKSLDRWLEGEFSQWHTKLYKRRPVIWHIASPRGTFGALVYYHKLDRDTLPKVRNVYLRTLRDGLGWELERVRSEKDYKALDRLEAALDDLTVLDERLGRVIEAGYDPVIDNGVKANLLPLQEAEVLRHKKVV